MSDRGSLSILIAGYLALAVLIGVTMTAVGISLIAQNRVQAVADSAILFAHDRAVRKGVPQLDKLKTNAAYFLQSAPSAKGISISSFELGVSGQRSELRLCARYLDPIGMIRQSGLICRTASAQSFLVD